MPKIGESAPSWAATQRSAKEERELAAKRKSTSTLCLRGLHLQCVATATCKCDCHGNPATTARVQREARKQEEELDQMDIADEDATILGWADDDDLPVGKRAKKQLITNDQQAALKRRPGMWGRLRYFDGETSAGSYAQQHKQGKSTLDPEEWEIKGGKRKDGEPGSELWARYIGPPETNDA